MEIDRNPIGPYALALLSLVGSEVGRSQGNTQKEPLFGLAMRLEIKKSTFEQPAHKVLHALIQHSPAPEAVAGEFFEALGKCKITAVITLGDAFPTSCETLYVEYCAQVDSLKNGDPSVDPASWATMVYEKLTDAENEEDRDIPAVTLIASFYLTNLIVACRARYNICWL